MTEPNEPIHSAKRVDEDWKEQVAREKSVSAAREEERGQDNETADRPEPVTSELFLRFFSGLATQALSALGEMPNPLTDVVEENLEQAKYLIDTIGAIAEKTEGNLSAEESHMIKESLYTLRMKFVAKSSPPEAGPASHNT